MIHDAEVIEEVETETAREPVRVAALDDHYITLVGLRALAAEHPEQVTVTRAASSVAELLADGLDAEVVLLDLLGVPDQRDPDDTVRQLTARGVKVVLHTSSVAPLRIRTAMAAGAVGLVLKAHGETVLEAVRLAAAGEYAVTGELAYVLVNDPELMARLAPREIEGLTLLAQGVPKKAIGRKMTGREIKTATVSTYFSRIGAKYAALGRPVGNSVDLIREAYRDGYLDWDEAGWARELLDDDRRG